MSWSREQVSLLIDEYKKCSCLYAVKSADYKNKHSRTRALEDILKTVNLVKPGVTINDIKAKFHGVKSNFLAEYRKYYKSLKSGAGEDDVYQPIIWYFEQMMFILHHCIPRQGRENIEINAVECSQNSSYHGNEPGDSQDDAEKDTQFMDDYSDNAVDCEVQSPILAPLPSPCTVPLPSTSTVPSPSSSTGSLPTTTTVLLPSTSTFPLPSTSTVPVSSPRPSTRKRKHEHADRVMEEASDALKLMSATVANRNNKPSSKHHLDVFAEFVASKMKQMDQQTADEVEENITMLLYARQNKKAN